MVTTIRGFCGLMAINIFVANAASAVEVRPPLENAITRGLQTKIAVHFQETPLREAVTQLAAAAKVPLRWDHNALREEGIVLDSPVTLLVHEQPIAETLAKILHPRQMGYDPRGELLVITTPGMMDETLSTRRFDVSQLVELIKPRLESIPIRHVEEIPQGDAFGFNQDKKDQSDSALGPFGGAGMAPRSLHKLPAFRTKLEEAQHRFPAEYCLMGIIQENSSGQWEEVDSVGGTMTPSPGCIRIRNTERVHHEAYQVLANLETFLRDPKKYPQFRLHDDEEDRRQRAAFEEVLDTISAAPTATIPLQRWIDDNLSIRGLNVIVDPNALRDEGITWTEVMLDLAPQVSRRRLFDDAMNRAQLMLVYEDDVWKLTTDRGCDWPNSNMLFDISDLPQASDFDWLAEYLYSSTSAQWEAVDGVGGTVSTCGVRGLLFVHHSERTLREIAERLDDLRHPLDVPAKPLMPQRTRSIYTLPDVVTATDLQAVLPKLVDLPDATWPEDAIQRVGAMLIVQQTEFVHRRIETVIEAIRKAHAAPAPEIPETR